MRIELMATLAVQIDHALLQWLGYHVGKLVVERGRQAYVSSDRVNNR